MKNKSGLSAVLDVKAFTLIELLVVVLIIGILAAVVLPQYKVAVEKSKAVQLFVLLKTLAEAEETYHMSNGSYTTAFDLIPVDIPGRGQSDENENEHMTLKNGTFISLGQATGEKWVYGYTSHVKIGYLLKHHETTTVLSPDMIVCIAQTQDKIGSAVCKGMSGGVTAGSIGCGAPWPGESCIRYVIRR